MLGNFDNPIWQPCTKAVADYTCVAVNAGGVMEENISLTFEEPEPVRERVQNSLSVPTGFGFLSYASLLLPVRLRQ